jgi:hypothetical protein
MNGGGGAMFSGSVCNAVTWNGTYWLASGTGTATQAYSYDGIFWTTSSSSSTGFSSGRAVVSRLNGTTSLVNEVVALSTAAAGSVAAIATLQGQVATLQSTVASQAASIATLQSTQLSIANQVWRAMSYPSRTLGTTYTNPYAIPIQVSVGIYNNTNSNYYGVIRVGGVTVGQMRNGLQNDIWYNLIATVPPGSTYGILPVSTITAIDGSTNANGSGLLIPFNLIYWSELY